MIIDLYIILLIDCNQWRNVPISSHRIQRVVRNDNKSIIQNLEEIVSLLLRLSSFTLHRLAHFHFSMASLVRNS